MMDSKTVRRTIEELLARQRFGVLATQSDGNPFTSLVSFAVTGDLRRIIFMTSRGTAKYANMMRSERVSMLIDSRSNRESDIRDAVAVTVTGKAREVDKDDQEYLKEIYLNKHPYLKGFAQSPATALICIDVKSYVLVARFQEVETLDMAEG
ncbi:MAG: pyridoxamine 5'-phosphate oxidase family protein [Deltaproteobacteria bacterium]|nr:pyridoxamine 5'-phosphate oxidase family protein [Deltaproteobacteria bacterium]